MSILSLFDIGRTALTTTRRALDATGHNVANSATPGYSRQEVTLQSIPGSSSSFGGAIGRGVNAGAVLRMYDSFTSLQLITEKSSLAYWDSYQSGVVKIENIFNEASDTGIYPAIADFFNAWQEVSQNPEAYAQRTLLINKAEYLAGRINRAATALYDERDEIYAGTQTIITEANTILQRISDLNEKIASNPGALDLKDQRDVLLEQLNGIVKVTSFDDGTGRYTVLLGGTPLIEGANVYQLSTSLGADATMRISVQLPNDLRDVTNLVTGGELKANLDVRDSFIPQTIDKLNVFAIDLADQVNYYHRAGYALDGTTDNSFFGNLATTSDTSVAGSISSVRVSDASAFNYHQYTITYNDAAPLGTEGAEDFVVFDNTLGAAVAPAGITYAADASLGVASRTLTFNGIAIKIDGALVDGETFSAQLNANAAMEMDVAVNDPAKIAAAAGDYVVVSTSNNVVRFSEDGGATYITTSIPTGTYTRQQIAAALGTALENAAAGAQGYTVSFSAATNKYTIAKTSAGTAVFDWNATTSTAKGLLGFTSPATITGAASIVSNVAVLPNLPGDNGNASIMSNLFNQSVIAGSRPADFYQSIVSDVGVTASSALTSAKAQNTLVEQLENRRQEISGVNLDEEAANLIKFQKSYEAAAKMITVADDLLTTLMDMVGR